MPDILTRPRFKQAIVLFWGLWWLFAFLTDFIGGLEVLGVLSTPWFDGQNYPFLQKTLAPFGASDPVDVALFVGIIAWALLSTLLYAIAICTPMQDKNRWMRRVDRAFIVSLGLWLAFFLADQVVMNFDLEQNHMVQGGFQLLCYLTIYLLPDEVGSARG